MTAIAIGTGIAAPQIGVDLITKGLLNANKASGTGTLLSLAFLVTKDYTIPATKALIDLGAAKLSEYQSIKNYTATLNALNSRIYTKPAPIVSPSNLTKIKPKNNALNPITNLTIPTGKNPTVSEFKAQSTNLGQTPLTVTGVKSVPISQKLSERPIGRLIANPIRDTPLKVSITNFDESWSQQTKNQEQADLEYWLLINYLNASRGAFNDQGDLETLNLSGINPLDMGVTAIPLDWDDFDAGWTLGVGSSALLNRSYAFTSQSSAATSTATGTLVSDIEIDEQPPPPPPKKQNWLLPIALASTATLTSSQHQANVTPSSEYPEDLLIFLGKCALYEGGAEHYDNYLKDKNYYKTVDFKIVDFNTISAKSTDGYAQFKKQKLNIPNEQERQKVIAGIQHLKQGMHEFPAVVPNSLINTPANKQGNNALKIPSMTAFTAWFMKQHSELMGSFPMHFKESDDNGNINEQQIPNIATALTTLLGIGALNASVGMKNFNLSQRNTGAINANMLNSQFANETLNALSNCMGCSSSPVVRNSQLPTNTQNPSSYKDMLKEKLVKRQGVVDDTSVSVHEKLEKLQFMTSVIFNSVYKKKSEFEDEEKKMEDLVKKVEKFNKEDWTNFKKALEKDDNALTKNGAKMKIEEVAPKDPNKPFDNSLNNA